jgi:hypothetical protein
MNKISAENCQATFFIMRASILLISFQYYNVIVNAADINCMLIKKTIILIIILKLSTFKSSFWYTNTPKGKWIQNCRSWLYI